MDGRGRVVEVKESKFGSAARYENELPFVGVLPADGPKAGQEWRRDYKITLEPPHGAGEKYDAIQKYVCKDVTDGVAVTTVTTGLKTPPPAAEQAALLQLEPEGEIVFDLKAGRLKSAVAENRPGSEGPPGRGHQLPRAVHVLGRVCGGSVIPLIFLPAPSASAGFDRIPALALRAGPFAHTTALTAAAAAS